MNIAVAGVAASATAGALVSRLRFGYMWVPTSQKKLAAAELLMYENVRTPLTHTTVQAGKNSIHTVSTRQHAHGSKPTLVLVHGFGGGVGLWANNIDELSQHYNVYAIDVLGFGQSSRPSFRGSSAADGRDFFVNSLEEWRQAVGLNKFVLLGHSLGGYICTEYSLKYSQHVDRLILAAPFGVSKQPLFEGRKLPLKWRIAKFIATKTSPQTLLRVAGPFGPKLLHRFRGRYDNGRYDFDDNRVSDYVYHLCAAKGSGEYAFMALQDGIGFAKEPLLDKMQDVQVPMTLIYGEADFIQPSTGYEICKLARSSCDMHVIPRAAHHAYATHPDQFHSAILNAYDLDTRALAIHKGQ
eukprot:TRINITY_DN2112_c0_g1_i1.p1 TRINITY_DN2112_c0_g1~~TRINITY_DN2112_c0_g1_i1.p1  ORF type:complete len:354 (+),score=26.20 TRINITY_DN2112_c0_g1_i1:52-1113(+)